jgi:glycosyltransferase involved in cell wall biosynthesis
MKLLFFGSDYKIGLSSFLTDQIIAYNQIKDLSILVLCGEREQEINLRSRLKKESIRTEIVNGLDDHRNFLGLKRELTKIIKSERPELIHVQNNWQLILIALIRLTLNMSMKYRIIYTIHGFRNNAGILKRTVARFLIGAILYLFADKVIYMSGYVYKSFKFLNHKMIRLHYGIGEMFFNKTSNIIKLDKLRLIFPAAFRTGKNQDLLIRAFASYCREKNDKKAELYLPGDGKFKTFCQELTKKLGVSDQVIFPGLITKENLFTLYEKCNTGIIPSESETFGQCIIEPYVCGRCIITRRVGIADEIIEDGINGYFFDNEEELKSILSELSCNTEFIQSSGNLNFDRRNMFSWESSREDYSSLIDHFKEVK